MLCLGCVSKVNSENDEYQSWLPCVSKLCGCPKRVNLRSENSGKSGAINFSISNKINVEVSTQNEKHDADWTTEQLSPTPCGNTKGKLEFEEGAPESANQ